MRDTSRPTQAELDILAVLWRRGEATVREVHDELAPSRGTGYTTTLKLMQLMVEKGLLDRDDRDRSHRYRARVKAAPAQRRALGRMIDRMFGGSTRALVQHALDAGAVDAAELDEIRRVIDAYAAKARARGPAKGAP